MEKVEVGVSQSQMRVLMKLWLGLYPLPVTFWLVYVCGPNALELLYISVVLAELCGRLGDEVDQAAW